MGSFKQTIETSRRNSRSSSPPQKKTADFHHGHIMHSTKVIGITFSPNSETNRRNGTEPRLTRTITPPPPAPPSTLPFAPTSPPQRPRTNTYSPSNSHPSPPPSFPTAPRQPPPTPRQSYRNEWNFNPDGVGKNRIDLLESYNWTIMPPNVKSKYSTYDLHEYITPINTIAVQILQQKRNPRNTSNSLTTHTSFYKLYRNLESHIFVGATGSTF